MLIHDEFLWECLNHPDRHPEAELKFVFGEHDGHECQMVNSRICFTGSILRNDGLIYRIGEYNEATNCWVGCWPD